MSVQQNHYVVIGAMFDYDEFYGMVFQDRDENLETSRKEELYHDNAFDGIHHHNDLCIIPDGMSGKYVVVGRVLNKSKNYGSLGDYIDSRKQPSANTVSRWIEREFNIVTGCKLIAFTHHR